MAVKVVLMVDGTASIDRHSATVMWASADLKFFPAGAPPVDLDCDGPLAREHLHASTTAEEMAVSRNRDPLILNACENF